MSRDRSVGRADRIGIDDHIRIDDSAGGIDRVDRDDLRCIAKAVGAVGMNRRRLLLAAVAVPTLDGLAGCASAVVGRAKPQVVVVGGGYGGATAARHLRLWSGGRIDVTMVEPEAAFVSCPLSNLVLGGSMTLAQLTVPYGALVRRHGVRHVRDRAARIDLSAKRVVLASGATLPYDTLVLSPGVEMMWDRVAGAREAHAAGHVLQAWQAGPETDALRRQLVAMPDGGTCAITVPEAPYRCPPGPYERACQIASYFKAEKPRSKVLILDANPDVTSKGALFKRAWADLYPGMVEHRPLHELVGVDTAGVAAGGTLRFAVQDDVRADVLNVLPPQRAGAIAVDTGLANANGRWCRVDFLDFASTVSPDVHVLGDAIQVGAGMPKSGHMANGQAKVCAAAIVARYDGQPVDGDPKLVNTCYSHVDAHAAMHVASVHAWDAANRTYAPVAGAGGLSPAPSVLEGRHGQAWARHIWADMLS